MHNSKNNSLKIWSYILAAIALLLLFVAIGVALATDNGFSNKTAIYILGFSVMSVIIADIIVIIRKIKQKDK